MFMKTKKTKTIPVFIQSLYTSFYYKVVYMHRSDMCAGFVIFIGIKSLWAVPKHAVHSSLLTGFLFHRLARNIFSFPAF